MNKDELYMCVWDAWRNRVYQGLKRSQIMHECGLPAVVQRSPPIQCSMPRTSLRATPKARLCTKGPRCCRQGYTTDRGDLPTLGGQGTRRIGGTYRPLALPLVFTYRFFGIRLYRPGGPACIVNGLACIVYAAWPVCQRLGSVGPSDPACTLSSEGR